MKNKTFQNSQAALVKLMSLKQFLKQTACSFLFSLIVVLSSFAQSTITVKLFNPDGTQKELYEHLLRSLRPQEILEFNDGARYEIQEFIKAGNTTAVFLVKSLNGEPGTEVETAPRTTVVPTALRLPLRHDESPRNGRLIPTLFLDYTIEEYPKLLAEGIPVPAQIRSLKGQYVEVPFHSLEFDLYDFFSNGDKLDPEYRTLVLNELAIFARKTAAFTKIGDFRPGEVFFDSVLKKWILIDYSSGSRLFDPTSFIHRIGIPPGSVFGLKTKLSLWGRNILNNKSLLTSAFQKQLFNIVDQATNEARFGVESPGVFCNTGLGGKTP